jgi:hypothetical protein
MAFQSVDPAFDGVPLFVVTLVELRRAATAEPSLWRLRIWSAFSGVVHLTPRLRR